LGWHGELAVCALAEAIDKLHADRRRRVRMAERGPRLVDGLGAARVLEGMHDIQVNLRPVRPADCRLLWEWANEPAVRAVSFNPEPIPWDQHQQWFAAKLNDRACIFWIAEDNPGTPV